MLETTRLLTNNRIALRRLMRSRAGLWLLAAALGLLATVAGVALLALSGWFITATAIAGAATLGAAYSFNYLLPGGAIRFFAISRTFARYAERLASHNALFALLADLRSLLFARLAASRKRLTSSTPMHRLVSDIELLDAWPVRLALPWLWGMALLALWLLFAALAAPRVALATALPLLAAGVLLPAWGARHAQALALQHADGGETRRHALLQPLAAITALLQWGQWARFAAIFEKEDAQYQRGLLAQNRLQLRVLLGQRLGLALAAGVLLWQGSSAVAQGTLSVPVLLALLLGLFGLGEALQALGQQVMALGLARAAQHRLNDLLATTDADATQPALLKPPNQPLSLHLQNISARHPGALNGIENLDLHLQAGDVLWVQGASGAGKSTLLAVLAGELAPSPGSMHAWDLPYAHIDWSGRLGYLGQTLDVFDLTLAENLRLGQPQASDADLWQALEQVALADWARALPQQLNTLVGEYGATLSGGQARRVALARLLLKPHDLLLLDEPLAGLDAENRQALVQQLVQHQRQGILIIASHHPLDAPGVRCLRLGD